MVKPTLKVDILFIILAILIILLGFFYYNSLKQEKIPITEKEIPEEKVITAEKPVAEEEIPEELPEEAEEEIITEEIIEEIPAPVKPEKEVLVYIKRYSFEPQENYTIAKGTTITWKSIDSRLHRIACYEKEERFFFSAILNENETTSHTFNKVGEFLCIDAVFGMRSNIIVKQKVKNEITGAFIGVDTAEGVAIKLSTLFLLAISLTVFVSIYKKKWQTS